VRFSQSSAPRPRTVRIALSVSSFAERILLGLVATRLLVLHVTNKGEPARAATSGRKSSQAKVSAHRRRLRAQGLRPIQIWVPDMRAPGFKAKAHRQSLAVARSPQASEDQSFIDAVSDLRSAKGSNEAR
jgi:hypothetical protein